VAQNYKDPGAIADTSQWPAGIRQISVKQMGYMGVDDAGTLYWDGKPIEVRKRLDLTRGERVFAVLVGLFTIAGSVGAVAQGWAAAHQWSCQTGVVKVGCPVVSR